MKKKLITEMKFMMERLENPRMTYTQYERKRNNLIKEDTNTDILKFLQKQFGGEIEGNQLRIQGGGLIRVDGNNIEYVNLSKMMNQASDFGIAAHPRTISIDAFKSNTEESIEGMKEFLGEGKELKRPMMPERPSTKGKGLPEKPSKKSPFLKPEVEPELNEGEKNLNIRRQIKGLKKGDEIIIHKPSQKGEGINTPVIFLKYNRLWDWIIVEKDGKELKVGVLQDPQEEEISIEKLF